MGSRAVPLLLITLLASICMRTPEAAHSAEDEHALVSVHSLVRLGSQMNRGDVEALEERIAKNPDDVEARTKILGYYFIKGRQDPDAGSARQRHIVWLIENAPESEILGLPYGYLDRSLSTAAYDQAKQAWLKVMQESPEDLAILRNASKFFLLQDRKLSEELLLKGRTLDAKDPDWPASLGQFYRLGLMSMPEGSERTAIAEKAFRQYQLAYDLSGDQQRVWLLADMAKAAFAAGLKEDAKKLAMMMLDDDAAELNRGNRIHHGNLILGRIALADGDVEEAKARLLLAGRTEGSPNLNSFGPNMQLAKELLDQGETEVVLEYFQLCKKFWAPPGQQLDRWTDDVKGNRDPEFGGNLFY